MYSLYQAMYNLVNTLIYMCKFTVPTYIYKLQQNFLLKVQIKTLEG